MAGAGFSQTWQATATIDPYPSPYLSDWQTDPTLAGLEIVNPSAKPDVIIAHLEVTSRDAGVYFKGKSQRFLVQPGQPLLINSTEFTSWQTESLDEGVKQKVQRSGMMPEGTYEACITIRNLWGVTLVEQTCAAFTIAQPEPPDLVYPLGGLEVADPSPIFEWIPPQLPPAKEAVFVFRMVELLHGQTPDMALASNYPQYENFNVLHPDFEYPIEALPLEPGKTYAWRVQALDWEGKPITKNEGLSEIGTFGVSADVNGVQPELQLLYPEDRAIVAPPGPEFQWIEPTVMAEGPLHYTVRIVEIRPGQTPDQALRQNILHFSSLELTGQTSWTYPVDAPDFMQGNRYAWQVQTLDGSGNPAAANQGLSAAWTFSAASPAEEKEEILPERLPLVAESVAYLELKRNGKPVVNYQMATDSVSLVIQGPMNMVLPSLQTGSAAAPQWTVNGQLTFNPTTLVIQSGQVQGDLPQDAASPFNLSPAGVPLILTQLTFGPDQSDRLECRAVPFLFNRISGPPVDAAILSDGTLQADLSALLTETVPVVPNSDKLLLKMNELSGTIHASLPSAAVTQNLSLKADLLVSTPSQTVQFPVDLRLSGNGAEINNASSSSQSLDIDLGSLTLGLSNMSCQSLRYNRTSQSWLFDLQFDLVMDFSDLGVSLPAIRDVHMSRLGIEIPQISLPDLGIQANRAVGDLWIKPRAFRMYSYTFNWAKWNGGDIGDFGFFWDLDIQLPYLPQHLSAIDQTPFRANNAAYVNGAFKGAWNARTFEPPLFAPMADGINWGLSIRKIQGSFPQQPGNDVAIGVEAIWVPPAEVNSNASDQFGLSTDQLHLSPKGIFTVQPTPIPLSNPIQWGSILSIQPQSAKLTLGGADGKQSASLGIQGSVVIPTRSGGTIEASGEGTFDLFTWSLVSGQFVVQNAFAFGLPEPDYLIGLECGAGAILNPQGLHVTGVSNSALLSSGDAVSCQSAGDLVIALPGWELASGTVLFKETFGLSLSQWKSGKSHMKWRTLPASGDVQSGTDNLFMSLPTLPRMDGNALIASGNSQAVMMYKSLRQELDAEFSNDFLFSLSPTGVKRGSVQFSISKESVAVLDSNGLHLGAYFGETLATAKIGLPDTAIAYLSMEANPNLSLTDENGLKRIKNPAGQTATIHFPALKYQGKSIPTVQANVNILIDLTAYILSGGTIQASGTPLVSLADGKVPLEIVKLDFESGKWTASVKPILPLALRQNHLVKNDVSVNADGFGHFDSGFSISFAGSPKDSVVLGDYLTVTLDGIRCIAGGTIPAISFSGDFKSPILGGRGIHFTSSLNTDSASFTVKTLNVEPSLGCGTLALVDQGNLPWVEAPMNRQDFVLAVCGILRLDSLSKGFGLTLPRLEIRGSGITLIQPADGTAAQSLKLFGTEITARDFTMAFSTPKSYDLVMNGSMKIFGKSVDFTGLSVPDGCSVADRVLAQSPKGVRLNMQMILNHLETRSGNLVASLEIFRPEPFIRSMKDTLSLAINPKGQWLDVDGNPQEERRATVFGKSTSDAPRSFLGDNKFSVNAYLTGITLGLDGPDNTGDEGFIDFQVDTYWPKKELTGAADSVCIRTDGIYRFNKTYVTECWSFSQDTPVDTVTTVLDNNLFMHASTFSMADTAHYQIYFNCVMQLPLPSDVIDGTAELTGNRLGSGLFEFGKLHTAQVYIAGLRLELFDFHFARNEMVDTKEIEFTKRVTSVQEKQIMADLYLSFGAKLSTDFPGLEFGVDRFVIFKSADEFHLLIKHATIWIGDKFWFDLDLIGSIWKKEGEKTQFKWLIGGNMDLKAGQFRGAAVVGEVSFRETIGVDGKPCLLPGFGLFVSVNVEIDFTPIPLKLLGFGAGFFFNPSREVREMVYFHTIGYDELENKEICEEFQKIMDAMQNDMMTVCEIYLYGAGAIPNENVLQGKILLTLASDRIKVNAKVWPSDKVEALKGKIDLAGFIDAECAWNQDFSSFKYLAGHFKLGARAAMEEKYILKCPESAQVMLDFIVTGKGQFAISGSLMVETMGSQYLTAECDFTFGTPGFAFNGSVGFGFNMYILYIEAGMDMTMYLKWFEPVKFGISLDCYVQGAIISDWLCGFRGEMGAALVVEPDLFIYGYAELTGTILGVSSTLRVWAKWEEGGGMSSGTGSDPTMDAIVNEAQAVADEIMSSLMDLKAEIGMLDVLQYGGLNEEEVRKIIQGMSTGLYDQYIKAWDEDYTEFGNVVVEQIDKMDEKDLQTTKTAITEQAGAFFDGIIGLRDAMTNEGFYPLWQDMQQIEPFLAKLKTSMQNRVERLQSQCDELVNNINAIDFSLDTLLVLTDIGASPIRNPFNYTIESIEGVNSPIITFDESMDKLNNENIGKLQQALEGWLSKVESNIQKIRKGREGIFAQIGPESPVSTAQEELSDPLLSTNGDFTAVITHLNQSFAKCYGYYYEIPFPWNSDEIFTIAANDRRHRTASNQRRLLALSLMQVPTGTLPVNDIDLYRVLGNLFYRKMPQVILRYYVQNADSLMLAFNEYAKGIQSNLDKVHQNFTSNTDLIWSKYAELSEKVYAICDMYRLALKNIPKGGGENLVLRDSTDIILTHLEKEFTYPTVNPVMGVTQTQGFMPVTVTLDCQPSLPDQIAEHAVSLDNGPPQSLGKVNRINRDYILRHGVSYWYETEDGGIAQPFTNAESRSVTISPRVRNKAGLATAMEPSLVSLHGKDWKYGNLSNTVSATQKRDSMFRCLVRWPYPGAGWGDPFHFGNTRNELMVQWSLQSNYGVWGYTPVPAKHIIELKQGNKTVFGPETFPVTQTEMPDTFRVRLEGLDLEPNTGDPYSVIIHEYDVSDALIGTSSGSADLHGRNDDGSILTVTQTWASPPLYIDTTPPVITGEAEHIRIGSEAFVIYRLPKAKDEVRTAGGVHSEWISNAEAYEYQLLSWNEDADSSGWVSLEGSDLIMLPRMTAYNQDLYTLSDPGSGCYYVNFGSMAFADSLKFIVRARNERPLWNTGYSAPAAFMIPKADESEAPNPATFNILGLNTNRDLEIAILQAGTDNLSGISHYPWRLIQNLYRSKNPIVTVWHPEFLRFPADSVQAGSILTIPIQHDSIDVDNAFTVELVTFDHCGNFGYTQQEFQPGPPAPVLTARLLEGMKPFTLTVTGDVTPLSENYIDSLAVHIGTVPDASDILVARKSFPQLVQMSNIGMFSWRIDLPAAVEEGTSIYLSMNSIRAGQTSASYTQRIQLYQPMFQAVETDAEGYLVLPILHSPFNGQREVTAFKWAAGFIAPSLSGQNRYQLTIQPLTELAAMTGEQVVAGARIRLPIKAGDVRPNSLIVLHATALDGEIHATYREAKIVPPKPELKADLALDPGEYDRFFYRLNAEVRFGTLFQTDSKVALKIGSNAGAGNLQNLEISLVSYLKDGFTPKEIFLDNSVSQLARIVLTAFSKTAEGITSIDSTTLTLDVPWPPFWKDPKVAYDGNLTILPLRHGSRNANEITGYQFAVGDGEGSGFDLRPYPGNAASIDIPSSAWRTGEILSLPFSAQGLINKTYRVGIRAVLQDGSTNEQSLITKPFLQPVVDAAIIEAFPQNKLRVQGNLGPEMVAQISMKELRIELTLNGGSRFYRTFTVPDNGIFDIHYDLPDMPLCETYQFKSYFWHTQSQQFASYVTGLDMPCEPMFTTVDADSQDMIFADVLREAFNGNRAIQGYQFALGSGSGSNDVRPFPAQGQFDFQPAQVQAGKRLTLPQSLIGIPSTCFVSLRGIDAQGKIHLTEKPFQARPPQPRVLSLKMDKNGRFTAEFDRTRFDNKVRYMDCWTRSARDQGHVISFNEAAASDLQTGTIAFGSGFTEADLGQEFIFEGLNLGYQINSLDFQYRFRIEKAGDAYRIIPLP